MTGLTVAHVAGAVPQPGQPKAAGTREHLGGDQADHGQMPEAVGHVDADAAVGDFGGDGLQDALLRGAVGSTVDQSQPDFDTQLAAHQRLQRLQRRGVDAVIALAVDQFQTLLLGLVARGQVLDQHTPHARCSAEDQHPIHAALRLQMVFQGDPEKGLLRSQHAIGKAVIRAAIATMLLHGLMIGTTQKGHQRMHVSAPRWKSVLSARSGQSCGPDDPDLPVSGSDRARIRSPPIGGAVHR